MASKHLLFELGSEELPPKTLVKLSQALLDNVLQGLSAAELTFTGSKAYATPRRLAVFVENLSTQQPDKIVEKRGPALQAAFAPDGKPSKAAEGFSMSCGTTFEQLERLKTEKGEWLVFKQAVKGQPTEQLIPDIIRQSISALSIAKRMRWGNFATEFVRPVHWAVLLYGDSTIECEILGLTTGSTTLGHRFHAPQAITINSPESYADALYQQGKLIVDVEQRKAIIRDQAQIAAAAVNGTAHIEDDLLEEIAALNEWPVPVTGTFDPRFLELPAEVLITTMQTNQKYFPVKNASGELLPYFITFSNIESTRPESIKQGNERVITPRLTDAEFFWKQDRKKSLEDRVESLANIVFQEKLGTLADKTQRVIVLSELIATQLCANVDWAKRAARLAKADLMTDMVGEFGNLQGIMGRYYALADNEPREVADAIEQHYYPKQSGSPTPSSQTGQVVALADKVDTLTGIFSAGLIPTGDKDPYALRRAALGTLRIIIENENNLDIVALVDVSLTLYTHTFDRKEIRKLVIDFIFDRLRGYCLDRGYAPDEFDAVISVNPAQPLDFMKRLQAVKAFRQLPEAESLAAANKRIRNILKKSDIPPAGQVGDLVETEERHLFDTAKESAADIQPFLEKKDYQAALSRLAKTESAVNAFFDKVMVMSDDLDLRARRLALLNMLSDQFLQIADISKLQS
ncbi:glycine--tRNA ligase subunit beta [Methyloglobulus sp.]|uniref:glycine--tRNA ligase subunit beta n=1 Tax=Methyloglobulus sp. TaxID=2518622 RepID=UPI00398A4D53